MCKIHYNNAPICLATCFTRTVDVHDRITRNAVLNFHQNIYE